MISLWENATDIVFADELSQETHDKIDEVIVIPRKKECLFMVIHLVQDELGAIDLEASEWIAENWNFNRSTFENLLPHPMLREKPWGKVRPCRKPYLVLSEVPMPLANLEDKLGVKEGHVSEDGGIPEFMECLADCGEGPVVMVDEETYENVNSEEAAKLAD